MFVVCVCVFMFVCVCVHGPISGLPSETAQCRQLLPVLSHSITCRWLSYTHTLHTHTIQRERERERETDTQTQTQTRHRHTFMEATYTNQAKSIQQNHAESTSLQHHTRTHAHLVPFTFNGCKYA
jgi:hypothetical protein